MQAEWYADYMSGTGFGTKAPVRQARELSPQDTPFQQEYYHQIPVAAQAIPGATADTGLIPGQAPLPPATRSYAPPQMLSKDGTKSTLPMRQVHMEAVGIGKQDDPVVQALQKEPAVQPAAQSAPREKQKATTTSPENIRNMKIAAGACGVTALLASFGVMKKSKYDKQFVVIAVISILLAVFLLTASKSREEKQVADKVGKAAQRPSEAIQVVRGVGEEDPLIAAKRPDPQDTLAQRYADQGLETASLEGPRSHLGYQRSAPTPDGRPVLSTQDLMRSQRHMNMDTATFEEYMRRLNGEAIPRVAQVQPYYTFNAQWEHRPQIDDSSVVHGIADSPDQMHRKSIYRQPRMKQAGARRMHLKDPPPGSVEPLEKVHPWLEREPDAAPVAFTAEPGERLIAEHGYPRQPIIEELQDEREAVRERMAFNAKNMVGEADENFLKTVDPTSEKKKRISSITAEEIEQKEQSQGGIHTNPEENQQGDSGTFESAFNAKETPGEEAIKNAIQEPRR